MHTINILNCKGRRPCT